ncbi:MAG: glycosyltransferase family 39 protein [Candidatus Methylopumilus sp.]
MTHPQQQVQQTLQVHIGALWLVLVLLSLCSRSYLPIDETRYVTVAWNMFLNHDFLVPYLNGATYSHKPPLLFWLMNLGWAVFGVNDSWPRLLPSIFALGAELMTQQIAKRLWPERPQIGAVAALILLSSGMWAVFTTATMFDMLVAFFTVWGVLGLLMASQGEARKGWTYVALAIAGGLLAKGPTILLQILPVAVLAPWWMSAAGHRPKLAHWYRNLLIAIIIGALILLAWAIPAGIYGGAQYQHEIFWGQTADRMVKSFAHRRPIYWYLPMLPVMLFPWLFALPIWRALAKAGRAVHEQGVRFCWAWFIPVLLAFSLISGKQPHYLLPIMPAFALLAGRGWDELKLISYWDKLLPALIGVLIGVLLLVLPDYNQHHYLAPWIANIPSWSGAAMVLGSVLLMVSVGHHQTRYLHHLALLGLLTIAMLYLGVIRAAGAAYDMTNISHYLKGLQDQNIPLANVGKYHGQFNFVGRMRQSPDELSEAALDAWFVSHPNGRVVMYFDKARPLGGLVPEYQQPYRAVIAGVLTQSQWQAWSKQPHTPLATEAEVSE